VESVVLRQLIAVVVATALTFGSIRADAEPVAASQPQNQPLLAQNQPPLKPAGAAGIREAQGIADVDVWFISGVILAAILVILLVNDDDEATDSTD
jgi:hypothetical protein